jgi:hypothetical protein
MLSLRCGVRRGFIDGQIDMRDRDIDSVQAKGG